MHIMSPNWRQMLIENNVSSDFDPCSSIVKNIFDCHLSSVVYMVNFFTGTLE